MTNNAKKLLLEEHLKQLRLPAIRQNYQAIIRDAIENNLSFEDFLLTLTELEINNREENQLKRRLKRASFPVTKTLDSFDFSIIPSINKNKVLSLSQADFVKEHENVIMVGNSGTGKTHLAIALGICACRKGFNTGFFTANGLATALVEAHKNYELQKLEKKWQKLHLVIIDELGYVPFTKTGAELLFQFIADRYERGSIIITTNLEFSEWVKVFGDEKLTVALLDRLTHRAHIITMNGESYRFRESIKRRSQEGRDHT